MEGRIFLKLETCRRIFYLGVLCLFVTKWWIVLHIARQPEIILSFYTSCALILLFSFRSFFEIHYSLIEWGGNQELLAINIYSTSLNLEYLINSLKHEQNYKLRFNNHFYSCYRILYLSSLWTHWPSSL